MRSAIIGWAGWQQGAGMDGFSDEQTAAPAAPPVPVRPQSLWHVPAAGWLATLKRAWQRMGDDNLSIVAAGVSFYAFLALAPLLGVLVFAYGLVATPEAVVRDITRLTMAVPADAAHLIGAQITSVVGTSAGKKTTGLVIAAALALFSARGAAGAIVTALNIVNEQREDRSLVRVTLLALGITAGAVAVAVIGAAAIGAMGRLAAMDANNATPGVAWAVALAGHALVFVAGALGASLLYRFGPAQRVLHGILPSPGAVLAGALWLVLNLVFGFYVNRLGHINATYGSLGAVVAMLTWLYLSSYVLLIGAELDAVLEPTIESAKAGQADAKRSARGSS